MDSNDHYKLPFALYQVAGERAGELLHGQLTNHIRGLKNNTGNYNLLLNLKGRVVADLDVLKIGELFHFMASDLMAPKILEHFQKYHGLMGTRITRVENIQIIHVLGQVKLGPQQYGDGIYQSNRLGLDGYDQMVADDTKLSPGMAAERWNFIRVENGSPLVGVDVTEKHLPQEGRLDHALHFDKGCYLGQEIIARLHYKGQVKKFLTLIRLETTPALQPPLPILRGNEELGILTSLVHTPLGQTALGLAILPKQAEAFTIAGCVAHAIDLPLGPGRV